MTAGTDEQVRIELVFSANEISARITALAQEIVQDGAGHLLVVPILTGSFVFAADLIRALNMAGSSPEIDFMSLSSYRKDTRSSGRVEILRDIELDVSGRDVLIIDDVLDSGRTLAFAKDLLSARGAGRVRTCVLLDKKARRAVNITANFTAFECPDYFVVGYGMDLAYRYRELPFVGRIVSE